MDPNHVEGGRNLGNVQAGGGMAARLAARCHRARGHTRARPGGTWNLRTQPARKAAAPHAHTHTPGHIVTHTAHTQHTHSTHTHTGTVTGTVIGTHRASTRGVHESRARYGFRGPTSTATWRAHFTPGGSTSAGSPPPVHHPGSRGAALSFHVTGVAGSPRPRLRAGGPPSRTGGAAPAPPPTPPAPPETPIRGRPGVGDALEAPSGWDGGCPRGCTLAAGRPKPTAPWAPPAAPGLVLRAPVTGKAAAGGL
jgi:hypothetical protein